MNLTRSMVFAVTALGCVPAFAQSATPNKLAPEQVPAKSLPVPTDVSPELQKVIAAPRNPDWDRLWKTGAEWRAYANQQAAKTMQSLPAMRQRLHVTVRPTTIDGVRAFVVTPEVITPEHRDQTLIHVHGGCYELFPGESGTGGHHDGWPRSLQGHLGRLPHAPRGLLSRRAQRRHDGLPG